MAAAAAAVLLGLAAAAVSPFGVDIHLPVGGLSREAAIRANRFLNARLNSSEVVLGGKDTPHVTLYLTQWSCPNPVASGGGNDGLRNPAPAPTCLQRIQLAIAGQINYLGEPYGPCTVELTEPFAAGQYAMMNVTNTPCLQRYSDFIVNITHSLSAPNQSAPSWVHSLPEPERSEKLRDIAIYGSPNVFGQFAPHVTVAWSQDANAVSAAVAALAASGEVSTSKWSADIVTMGSVGPHGTVLAGHDLGVYNVSNLGDSACSKRYVNDPNGCNADNTTDGGCVWCDIVDHPPYCTTNFNARTFEPPPRMPPFQCDWHE